MQYPGSTNRSNCCLAIDCSLANRGRLINSCPLGFANDELREEQLPPLHERVCSRVEIYGRFVDKLTEMEWNMHGKTEHGCQSSHTRSLDKKHQGDIFSGMKATSLRRGTPISLFQCQGHLSSRRQTPHTAHGHRCRFIIQCSNVKLCFLLSESARRKMIRYYSTHGTGRARRMKRITHGSKCSCYPKVAF